MTTEHFIKQFETYSNAIVGFSVLQSIGYGYYFGSNEFFNCLVKSASLLAHGLALMFLLAMILFLVALHYCRKALRQFAGESGDMVDRIYLAKMVAVVVFSLMPLSLTIAYGVMVQPTKVECNRIISDALKPSIPAIAK